MNKLSFRKSLAKYYQIWYDSCLHSAEYCRNNGEESTAVGYETDAKRYKELIDNNREAIEFFSRNDNAFLKDSALPEKFRGYK